MVTNNERVTLFKGFTLDLARGCVLHADRPGHLRPQSYEVLKYLVENKGRLISKDKLIEEVWQGRAVTDGSLGKCIEEVREALGPDARQYVRNVRGRGYIFDPGLHESSELRVLQSEEIDVVSVVIEDDEDASVTSMVDNGRQRSLNAVELASAFGDGASMELVPEAGRKQIATRSVDRKHPVTSVRHFKQIALIVLPALIIAAAIIGYFNYFAPRSAIINSIAVMPFTNVSGDPNMEYLSDGLTESLIYNLSQLPSLRVIPRSSVFRYKGKDADPQIVSRALGARAILEGRVVQRGDDLSISVELIDTLENKVLWGQQYNRKLTDALAMQQEI